jgi:hypothetical protein
MSMNISGAGGQPMVVSGATRSVSAPSGGGGNQGGQASASPVDFSSMLQSLMMTIGHAGNAPNGSNINTYA